VDDAVARGDYNKDPEIVLAPVLTAWPDHGSEPLVARLLLAVSSSPHRLVNANPMIARRFVSSRKSRCGWSAFRAPSWVMQLLIETTLVSLAGGAAALLPPPPGRAARGQVAARCDLSDVGFSRGLVLSVLRSHWSSAC
jgi:hypothetical protein